MMEPEEYPEVETPQATNISYVEVGSVHAGLTGGLFAGLMLPLGRLLFRRK